MPIQRRGPRLALLRSPTPGATPPRTLPLDAAAVSVVPTPNIVIVNGQHIEIVSPDEFNTIDLTVDTPRPGQSDVRRATTSLLA
jgi:hypothetical protein